MDSTSQLNQLELLCFLIWFSQIITLNSETWSDLPSTAWYQTKEQYCQNYQAKSWITLLLKFQPIESCDEPSMTAMLITRLYAYSRHLAWLRRSSTTPAECFSTDWIPWSLVICLKNLLPRSQCPQCNKQSKPPENNYIKFFFHFGSTNKEMLSWLGPWFADINIVQGKSFL